MSGKLTKAQKITALFDNDYSNTRSSVRTKLAVNQTYDPTTSWEGRVDNPKNFSKLKATHMPTQPIRPIILSGAAVVPLHESHGLEILNVNQRPESLCPIPLTFEQRDVGMKVTLKGEIPMCNEAKQANKSIVITENLGFKNMEVRSASFQQVDIPQALLEAGPQCDKKVSSHSLEMILKLLFVFLHFHLFFCCISY